MELLNYAKHPIYLYTWSHQQIILLYSFVLFNGHCCNHTEEANETECIYMDYICIAN